MCGIIGIAANDPFTAKELLLRLKRLEYRGYDSYGYASPESSRKDVGKIIARDDDDRTRMTRGIAHTRWATHGGVTKENAHPHVVGNVTLVHNGIIDNYETIAPQEEMLSQTDSERIAHRINESLAGKEPISAIREALSDAKGTWAIAMLIKGHDGIFVARNNVPLLIGATDGKHIIASDARGMPDAKRILALDEGQIAHVLADNVIVIGNSGEAVEPQWEENMIQQETRAEHGYAMEHEILETPEAIERLHTQFPDIRIDAATIIGCGSSYNAALLARAIAEKTTKIDVLLATEYDPAADDQPAIIAVSQSGETADVLDAVRGAKLAGKQVIALVNTPHSTLTRLADDVIYLHAGEERCVAATKSFTLQVLALASILGKNRFADGAVGATTAIRERAQIALAAREIAHAEHMFIIGRGVHYPLAMELSLKFKEIAYQHAEAVPALELKHGPLALITKDTPVLALGSENDARLASTIHEVQARDGFVMPLVLGSSAKDVIRALVIGQLLTFEVAKLRGTPIDHPRNLAKSVTVY